MKSNDQTVSKCFVGFGRDMDCVLFSDQSSSEWLQMLVEQAFGLRISMVQHGRLVEFDDHQSLFQR